MERERRMSEREANTTRTTATTERRLPVRKLGVMNRLGELGVEGVASRLERLGDRDGAEVRTDQVSIGFVEPGSVDATFSTDDRVGIRVHLPGAPHGFVLVLFPMASANNAATLMLSDAVPDLSTVENDLAHSALVELGAMMAYGFMDAWADTFDQRIDVGTPQRVSGQVAGTVSGTLERGDDLGVYIASRLHLPREDIDADVLVFPSTDTFIRLLDLLTIEQVIGER
jgi:chemotaxis protein CheY-P-specific phosphatase CheC